MYHNDAREVGLRQRETYARNHEDQTVTFSVTVEDDEGEYEETVTVHAKYEFCPTCQGRGQHVNPSIDANGLTAEDFANDPDFRDDYLSGTYDVDCYGCGGRTTILVPDTNRMNDDEKRLLNAHEEEDIADAEYAAECAHEQRMGY